MNMKSFIVCAALLATGLAASAQEKENPWFLQGQIGASYSSGDVPFGKLIGPSAQLAVGKYFTHVWGARLAFSGWQGRAPELRGDKADGFYYGAVTVDGLMNLSQLIKRYHERPFDVGIVAGVGFNRSFSHASSFMGRLGLQGSTRINEALDFNVELMANGVSDRWNGRDDHGIDTYFDLTIGLTYKFGTGFKCATCISEEYIEPCYSEEELNEMVNMEREQAQREAAARVDTVVVEPDCPPAKVVQGIRSHVTFAIGRTAITSSQEMNVQAVANYLKENPEAKATVSGYADKGTGTPEINHRLARQRAEAVRDLLVQKYGIDEGRLFVRSMESDEQPFTENDWNRVVIMVAE